jgi:hypothetical protein
MKLSIFVIAIATACLCKAEADVAQLFAGNRTVYLRVNLETRNGVDIRARTMPQQLIEKTEREGKQVRPTRGTNYVLSFWAFEANGSFKNFEWYNYGTDKADTWSMSSRDLDEAFAVIPPAAQWKYDGALIVGDVRFRVRILSADNEVSGGKKGEIEIAWLKNGQPVYFYLCEVAAYGAMPEAPMASAAASRVGAGPSASDKPIGFPAFDRDHTITLGPGQSVILARGQTARVPFGTAVIQSGPGGKAVTINGQKNTVNAGAGVIVSAPVDASGPADNLVIVK